VVLAALAAAMSLGEARAGGGSVPAPPTRAQVVSGFRMEGAAEVAVVFGDAASYRHHVDEFYAADEDLLTTRRALTEHIRAVLGSLNGARARHCPTDEVAPHYALAARAMERFEQVGTRYQTLHDAIQSLHRIGDTAALTPDYRWKVNRTGARYRRAVDELRELRVVFSTSLGRELAHHRCVARTLIAAGADVVPAAVPRAINPPPKPRRKVEPAAPAVPARDVTFFVDNRHCTTALSVFLDGEDLGDVPGGGRGVFRALAGRHSMCLVVDGTKVTCGQQGTVRHAFVYDGWSITMHCLQP
jgi:hypothetical protein